MAWIKKVYLYLVSLVSLVIVVVGTIMLINLALRSWVFTKADNANYYYPAQVTCDAPLKEGESQAYRTPECADPHYGEKMEQEEKERQTARKQGTASQAVAMIIVGAPVFFYHWKLARKEA
jgi:hypothetical protein